MQDKTRKTNKKINKKGRVRDENTLYDETMDMEKCVNSSSTTKCNN